MSRFEELWEGYLADKLAENEVAEFLELIRQNDQPILSEIQALLGDNSYAGLSDETREGIIFQQVMTNARERNQSATVLQWRNIAVAASIILVLAMSAVFLLNRKTPTEIAKVPEQQTIPVADVAPGGDKAVLKLADGTEIVLDSTSDGVLTQQGGIKVINLDGQLAYKNGEGNVSEVLYNTITTPRGGQYQLVLADGTKVWLNAASWLRFPTAFRGEERIVELKGEGYFEVAHNASKPFHVKVGDMDVQVLGTHFNINSYSDEPSVKTTLLEGRVKVEKNDRYVYLNPGQQALLRPGQENITIRNDVDLEQVIAWKNGRFYFNSADIESIMRQLARWYDVEVVYERKMTGTVSGALPRSESVSQLLKIFEATGKVNFEIEASPSPGRPGKIIVKPK